MRATNLHLPSVIRSQVDDRLPRDPTNVVKQSVSPRYYPLFKYSFTHSVSRIGDYNFPNLYRMLEPEFGTLSIFHVAKASKPHIKRIMHNDLGVDDSHLLCGKY